jgi:hypothetical protein
LLQVLEVDLQPLDVGQRVLHDRVRQARPERHADGEEGQAQGFPVGHRRRQGDEPQALAGRERALAVGVDQERVATEARGRVEAERLLGRSLGRQPDRDEPGCVANNPIMSSRCSPSTSCDSKLPRSTHPAARGPGL